MQYETGASAPQRSGSGEGLFAVLAWCRLSALPIFWDWFPRPLAQAGMESRPWRLEIGVRTAAGSTESRPTDVALVQWVKLSKREKTGAVEDLADIP